MGARAGYSFIRLQALGAGPVSISIPGARGGGDNICEFFFEKITVCFLIKLT